MISTSDPNHSANLPQKIAVNDCAQLQGGPDAWKTGAVIGYSLVYLMGEHATVLLVEGFPQHRIWMNFYNGGSKRWDGWSQV